MLRPVMLSSFRESKKKIENNKRLSEGEKAVAIYRLRQRLTNYGEQQTASIIIVKI